MDDDDFDDDDEDDFESDVGLLPRSRGFCVTDILSDVQQDSELEESVPRRGGKKSGASAGGDKKETAEECKQQ